ncbi:MAG TPA: aminotransferase class V-fold PLP-dependent enzyme [Chitinophagales bacterium]|nr:aminotransferase class V-fold PLP-dependent enzyme [Chitinophagales bacterium]
MESRKSFLKKSLALSAFAPLLFQSGKGNSTVNFAEKDNDKFWQQIREQFTLSPEIINLNNGAVSPQPLAVQQAHIENYQYSNLAPSYFMWQKLDEQREPLRTKVAEFCGVEADEIAFNRNTTEGLSTIIFGLNLKAGDEVIVSKYDYPFALNAWQQRALRNGIKLNWVTLHLPEEDENSIVEKYVSQITPQTKIIHLTHVLNWTGQIIPVRKIADAAKQKGCEVLVDGAHSFAHINFKISDLNCDYFAASFHKWLCAPFGTGFMFVKKEKIENLFPLLSSYESLKDNIRKFETLGTRSFPAEMAVSAALDFHQAIGSERKENRLRELKNYWVEAAKNIQGLKLLTSLKNEFSCGMATFEIQNKKAEDIVAFLLNESKIHTSAVLWEGLNAVRIAPSIYTNFSELDLLVDTLKRLK